MDVLQMVSSATSRSAAAGTVASALVQKQPGQVTAKAAPTATSGKQATSSSSTASTSSDITANDFLTLLVSELKNQDPTQPTDPNAYISQLVGVNSLQQLISINQGLTSIEPTATTSAQGPTTGSGSGTN